MSLEAFATRSPQPEVVDHLVRFVGGTAAVTKVEGAGVTVTYVSTGIVQLTWSDNPGRFMGFTPGFQATTPANVKGHTATAGVYSTTAYTLEIHITNASEALHDLAALEWLNLRIAFAQTGV